MYRLQVTKFVENEKYKEEMKEYKERSFYQSNINHPVARIEERNLDVTITDEEYKSVKKAILENFK